MAIATAPKKGTKIKFRPLDDRVVVEPKEAEETTLGGIILPDTAKEKPQRGVVISLGPGKMLKDGTRRSLQVKEGDTVLFTSWAGDEFKEYKAGTILLMREEDVLAVVDE